MPSFIYFSIGFEVQHLWQVHYGPGTDTIWNDFSYKLAFFTDLYTPFLINTSQNYKILR